MLRFYKRAAVMALIRPVVLLFLLGAVNSVIAATLEDVKFSELPGGRFEMRASFSSPPEIPKGYAIEKPARIVLDLSGVTNGLSKKKYPLSFGNADSAVVLGSNDRTRIILNLSNPGTYTAQVEGNTLIAIVDASTAAQLPVRSNATVVSDAQPVRNAFVSGTSNTVQDVDFRRGENGEGKVLLTLSNPGVGIDVEETGAGIVINFINTEIPEQLRRRLDVNDFATPVKIIESVKNGRNTRITIEATGDYDYLAYQADNQYVLSVKPLTKSQIEEKKARFAFVGEKLSLNFQSIEVRSVLQIIADFTDLNLVASDTVTGSITLRLDNVPWDQALDLVLKTKGLDKRQIGNVLMVAPAAEIAERERQEIETRKQLQELAPLRTEYIRIRYASAVALFELFDEEEGGGSGGGGSDGNSTGSILSERGQAIVDERTNSIILTDTEEKIAEFKAIIEQIDIPVRQVMVESRIVSAESNFRHEVGFLWTPARVSGTPDGNIASGSGNVSVPTLQTPTGRLNLNFINDNISLGMELQALESSGLIEIVSQPKVITGDKQQATIESGQQVPFTSSDGDNVTTVFRDAVLKLDVTPQITPDNRVIMDLKINRDSIGEATPDGPAINVTEIETQVLVNDGQTIVLGGIFTIDSTDSEAKVPVLGDIPYLGRLFKRTTNSKQKTELLIFITPKILSESLAN